MRWLWSQWIAVYPNLVASGICTVVVWVRLHVHAKRRHRQAERHHAEVLQTIQEQDEVRAEP